MAEYVANALEWLGAEISAGRMTKADAIAVMEEERDDPQEDYIPAAAQQVINTLTTLH